MIGRLRAAFNALRAEQRQAAAAAVALFLSMLLPWYTRDSTYVVKERLVTTDTGLNAFESFSFVELAILLVGIGVLVLLFFRADGRAFHLPGGDGTVIGWAGIWACVLVFYRFVDNKDGQEDPARTVDYGVTWGIFVTFLVAAFLAYSGWRIRAAHMAEPPLPGDPRPHEHEPPPTVRAQAATRPRRPRIDGGEQLTFDEQE